MLAFILGEKAADYSKTYGYKRFEILAAVFNGVTLVLIAIYIFYEAYQRFTDPPEVASTGMLIIATIGLLVNILVAWILMRGGDTKENLNIRAAFLHVIGDLLGSVGGHYCGSDDPLLQLGLGRSVGQCDCCSACIDKWVACDKRCRSCIDGGYP